MNLVDLNDDVLRYICDHLSGKDALHFALTAKHFHHLAITRVGVSFTAGDHYELFLFLRSGMHRGVPSRLPHLENLYLSFGVFQDDDDNREVADWSDDEDREIDEGEVVPGRSGIRLLIELLSGACNLRRLTLPAVHALLDRNARLAPALVALPRLQHVTLENISDTVVKFLGETGWDLLTLHLDYTLRYRGDQHPEEGVRTVPVLLGALAQFPNLHTLKITDLDLEDREAFPATQPKTTLVFPSIRRLFIAQNQALFALSLIDRCPNIEVVDLGACNLANYTELETRSFTSWPALRSLRVTMDLIHIAICTDRVLGLSITNHLQIADTLSVADPEGEDEYNIRRLLCILGKTSPVYAQLSVAVGPEPMNFWDRVAAWAPRLRYLELKVSIEDLDQKRAGWVDNVPDALSPLRLIYLRLHIAQLPDRYENYYEPDADGNPVWNATEECARALYHARYVAVQTFAERCARAIPTLQYFVLSDDGPTSDQCDWHEAESGKPVCGDDDDSDYAQHAERYEELSQLDPCCSYWRGSSTGHAETLQTWRVWRESGGEDGGCQLEMLAHEEGRRLYRTLVSSFDGRNEALTERLAVHT
ncbi:hypothetical protein C8Q76DRAFT_860238 [Earliella scabrosa]|nr:hypothetical protein C8Q76DRAFT_860238 [Earliella scabrosa]